MSNLTICSICYEYDRTLKGVSYNFCLNKKMADNIPFIRSFYEATKPLFVYGQNKFLEELNPKGGETICEIGCGNGNNLIKLFKRNQNLKLIGFDYSASMIKSTTERIKSRGLEKNIKLVSGLANEYQFEEQIDRFIFSYSLSAIPRPKEVLINVFQQLPPGGTVHIVDFGKFDWWPTLVKSPLIGFLSLFQVFPEPNITEIFEQKKECKVEIERQLGGYSFLAVLRRGL